MRTELVGREPELAVLGNCLEAALQCHARLVLCRGEPGIGKTRLAEEFLALAGTRGVPGVWGVAVDSAAAPPYWPWRQVFRALSTRIDLTAVAEAHGLTADVAGLLPEVLDSPMRSVDREGSMDDRFRQFDAVAVLLRQLTDRDPLVIVFHDAHWADRPSLLLLLHVARVMRDERLVLVVNHRDTEPMPRRPTTTTARTTTSPCRDR